MTTEIRALTLHQPYASLIAVGAKTYETRSWLTHYRGLLAIHAAKKFTREMRAMCFRSPFVGALQYRPHPMDDNPVPLGAILAVARVEAVYRMPELYENSGIPKDDREAMTREYDFGDFGRGRYAWKLTDVVVLSEPIPCRGKQGLWQLPEDVERQVREAVDE